MWAMTRSFSWVSAIACLAGAVLSSVAQAQWIVAVDAGHGGSDPGAIGRVKKVQEKSVVLDIARELKDYLNADPNFSAIMTRNSDKYIGLNRRTEIAREHRADLLVSIHADSSPNSSSQRGASIWLLSSERATNEMGRWLEDHESRSQLLGGAGKLLINDDTRNLNRTVLDLQYAYVKRIGYYLGKSVLKEMSKIGNISRKEPQYASLEVLRSPDIPSILVETGYLSNAEEEELLASASYRRKVAKAIYQGIANYRLKVIQSQSSARAEAPRNKKSSRDDDDEIQTKREKNQNNKKTDKTENKTSKNAKESASKRDEAEYYVVQKNDMLSSIAVKFNTTTKKLMALNHFDSADTIFAGKKIRVK